MDEVRMQLRVALALAFRCLGLDISYLLVITVGGRLHLRPGDRTEPSLIVGPDQLGTSLRVTVGSNGEDKRYQPMIVMATGTDFDSRDHVYNETAKRFSMIKTYETIPCIPCA
jgi:hypothetical protein